MYYIMPIHWRLTRQLGKLVPAHQPIQSCSAVRGEAGDSVVTLELGNLHLAIEL